jgi:sugar lactone lactonase YvrE
MRKILVFLIFSIVTIVNAQTPTIKNNPRVVVDKKTSSTWKLYNTDNSVIPSNMSMSVDIDSNSVIWYCTDKGVVKIDGENWTVLTVANSLLPINKPGKTHTYTTGLTVDKQNRIWIKFFDKIIMYDGNEWVKYDTINSPLKSVQDISVDKDGVVWFGTFYGAINFVNGKWTSFNTKNSQIPSNNVRSVFLDTNNILWVATDSGISTFNGSKWTVYNTKNSSLPSNSVNCINEDASGNIWIGTVEVKGKGGLVRIDKNGRWNVLTSTNSKLPWNTIEDIAIEGNTIWLGLNYGGVARLENDKWEIYNLYNSIIPHDFVRSIAIDKYGNKWIATLGGLVWTNR